MNSDQLIFDPAYPYCFDSGEERRYNLLLFTAMVAGKSSKVIAKKLTELLTTYPELRYDNFRTSVFDAGRVELMLRNVGIGRYKILLAFLDSLHRDLTSGWVILYPASRQDLLFLPGIGLKSSSMYMMYTERRAKVAVLDVHILRWFRDIGLTDLTSTPSSLKQYVKLERHFLDRAKMMNVCPWVLDIYIWRTFREKKPFDRQEFIDDHVNGLLRDPLYKDYVRP